jgi:carbon-monoxide dehydrogenase large subunit
MDLAASKLNLSQYEIRKRNFIEQGDLPHRTQTGLTYDSGNFLKAAEKCMELSDWDGFEQRCHYSRQSGKIRGRSLTSYVEDTGAFNDRMEVRFDPSGSATILAGTFSHGQSHETTYRQLLSAWLGIASAEIHFLQGDTNIVAFGRGTYASGSAHIGGNALLAVADQVIEKGKKIAAQIMKVEENQVTFLEGIYSAVSSNKSVGIQDVARASYHPTLLPSHLRNGLEGSAFAAADPPSFPNGCHVCEIEIDLDTGDLTLERYYAVDDFGIIINPLIAEGQVHGALAQGIGQAICEEVKYDEAGQVMTASFLDYAMPKASDFPSFATTFQVEPCLTNRLGVKGAGEGGTVAAPAAIANAVANALKQIKVQSPQMPFSSMTLWTAIHKKLHQ